jgi:hypothetical protein
MLSGGGRLRNACAGGHFVQQAFQIPDAADVVCGTKSFCYFSGDC